MADPTRGADGFYHPASLDEVRALIRLANQKGLQLRARGSMHSVRDAILTDGFKDGKDPGPNINIQLDKMTGVRFNDASSRTMVEAGCHLGDDPLDPKSTLENGFLYQLDHHTPQGGALDDLGGITHQTVSGFLSTGSAGGSLRHSIEHQIKRIRLVDGTGEVRELDSSQDEFNAAAISMGLLGVILQVEFEPTAPRYCIKGEEAITTVDECAVDLFGPGTGGRQSLETFLRETDYTRLMWWPQQRVNKVAVWQAERAPWSKQFQRQPYQEIGYYPFDMDALPADVRKDLKHLLENAGASVLWNLKAIIKLVEQHFSELPEQLRQLLMMLLTDLTGNISKLKEAKADVRSDMMQILIGLYFALLGNRTVKDSLAEKMFRDIFRSEEEFEKVWAPLLMNYVFVVDDKNEPEPYKNKHQPFQDLGFMGLPMDNQISDWLMPTEFTELWIPIEQTQSVMTDLKDFYETGGYEHTGTYACEVYGGKASEYWMSPAYHQDVVRIDVFWFGRNSERPDKTFYPQFWKLLAKYNFRPHWGKYLPPGDGATGVDYLRRNYPRWNDFMDLRKKYDPAQIFVTDYWRSHLGIPRKG